MQYREQIREVINRFEGTKVLIIGDVMVDSYLWGKVDRISPEAPVPVVHILKEENRPGGAANVAVNVLSLGAVPILCSITGNDRHGDEFNRLLDAAGMTAKGIIRSADRKTTVKTRVLGNHHQLVRIDDETTEELSSSDSTQLKERISALIQSERPGVIILEDYDKGIFNKEIIGFITALASKDGIPVTVDPKKKNFNTYTHVTLFKPNLSELRAGLKQEHITPDLKTLEQAVKPFLDERNIEIVMVTLSEHGVFIADKTRSVLLPAHIRDIADVSGAGDTVISVASLCLAVQQPIDVIAGLANLAGGLVCESVGVVPVDKEKLINEAPKALSFI
ncbi:MAG TPA: bifunctional ADP-heptose synthase [Bacteroidia bacterium]|nr:bifunctional ADP-heptose synthase [Bacteroidia bacterium]